MGTTTNFSAEDLRQVPEFDPHGEDLRKSEKTLAEKIIETLREPFLTLSSDLVVVQANDAFFNTFRVGRNEILGRRISDLGDGQWDIPALRELLTNVLPDNEVFQDFEVEYDFPNLGRRTMLLNGQRVNSQQLILLSIEDISERKRHEEELHLLIREAGHRTKNLLAIVQSMVHHSARGADVETFQQRLEHRLAALAASQDLMAGGDEAETDLADLVRRQLAFLGSGLENRIGVDGPACRIGPQQAQAIGMAVHELATNALKYGALSNDEGRVRLAWSGDGGRFRIEWVESGGPPVIEPGERGFGFTLIERMPALAVGGKVEFVFDPRGVRWTLDAPLPAICIAA